MIGRFTLLFSLFLLGFVAWMLSGSPVPMGFGFAFIACAFLARWLRRPASEGIVLAIFFSFLAVLAMLAQIWLFQTGLAFAFRADLPFAFHLGMAVLWFATSWSIFSNEKTEQSSSRGATFLAIVGFIIIYAAAWATELYDFDEWQIFPLAALPLALVLFALLRPHRSVGGAVFAVATLCGVLAATGWAVDRTTVALSKLLREKDSQLEENISTTRPPSLGGDGTGAPGARRLPRRTDIQFDDRVRLVIQTDSAPLFRSWRESPLYLRTSTVAIFESDELIAPIRSGRWLYDGDDEEEDHRVRIAPDTANPASYTVFCTQEAVNALPLLPRSQTVAVSALYQYADDWYQLTPPENALGIRFEASAAISRNRSGIPTTSRNLDPDVPSLYLTLPPSPLAGRIRELSREFASSDVLPRIRAHFDKNVEYTLRYDTPEDESPLGNILFGERKGHCELYAASAALLLRASGIPSRIAYGYAGGLMDRERQMVAFRDRDSHAWAEILTPENEWVVFDVTPNVPSAAPRSPRATSLADFEVEGYANLSEGAPSLSRGGRNYRDRLALFIAFASDHFIAVTVAFGLVATLFVGWQRRRRSRSSLSRRESHGYSSARLLGDLLEVLEDCGGQLGMKKRPGMTWQEWLSQEPDAPPCFADTVRYYYSVCYAGLSPTPRLESELRRSLGEWKEERVDH